MTDFPYLLIMIALPLVGAIAVGTMSGAGFDIRTVKSTALAFSAVEFVLAILLWISYRQTADPAAALSGITPVARSVAPTIRQTFSVDWIPSFGISFSLGVDGISLVMIALIALLVPIVIGASWEEKLPEGRTIGGYLALILVLQAAMTGVFAATNVFLFYVMFEVMLIPMYFLIGAFGGVRRAYAATKFFLYSLLGGLLMLASLIGLFVASGRILPNGQGSLDFATLRSIAGQIPLGTQLWIFAGFGIAFAIKAPLVPLHTWLPDAGAEAPVGAGTLLVGILDKVGTFGFLRICLPLLPLASKKLSWLIIGLGVLGIIYGAIVATGQDDLKRFVTYTSIAHFGFICMGIFAFTTQAEAGAVLYMVNHGIATALVFLVVGFLTARGGTRLIGDYGGVWKVAPIMGGLMLIGAFATVAVPGTNSFVSEFLVLIGTFTRYPAWSIVATTGIVFAALYMLWIFQRIMTGPIRGAGVIELDSASGTGALLTQQPTVSGASGQRDQLGGLPAGGGPGQPDPGQPGARAAGSSVAVAERPSGGHGAGFVTPVRHKFGDLRAREIAVLMPLVVLVVFLGVYPKPVLDVINPTAAQTVRDVGADTNSTAGLCTVPAVTGSTAIACTSTADGGTK